VIAIATGLAMSLLLFLAAPPLAQYALAAPQLSGALRISAAALLFTGVSGAQIGILVGLGSFKSMGFVNCATNLVLLVTTVSGAALCGLPGAIWGTVLGSAAAFASQCFGLGAERNHFRYQRRLLLPRLLYYGKYYKYYGAGQE